MNNIYIHGGRAIDFSRRERCDVGEVIDFSASINPLGLSPLAIAALKEKMPLLTHYPDSECTDLREALAQKYGLKIEQILIGNGSTELIHLIPRGLGIHRVLIPFPTFSEYERAVRQADGKIDFLPLREERLFQIDPEEIVRKLSDSPLFLCNPNNPTGQLLCKRDVAFIVEKAHENGSVVVLDEAFIDYAESESLIKEIREYPNLILLRSFTKFYGMPGLRVGYAVASPMLIRELNRVKPTWSVNTLALIAAYESLKDHSYVKQSLDLVSSERHFLSESLGRIPEMTVFPSAANYLLLKSKRIDIHLLESSLAHEKILVRNCSSFLGLSDAYIRVAVRGRAENKQLIQVFNNVSINRGEVV